jgi:hypothetical protein
MPGSGCSNDRNSLRDIGKREYDVSFQIDRGDLRCIQVEPLNMGNSLVRERISDGKPPTTGAEVCLSEMASNDSKNCHGPDDMFEVVSLMGTALTGPFVVSFELNIILKILNMADSLRQLLQILHQPVLRPLVVCNSEIFYKATASHLATREVSLADRNVSSIQQNLNMVRHNMTA